MKKPTKQPNNQTTSAAKRCRPLPTPALPALLMPRHSLCPPAPRSPPGSAGAHLAPKGVTTAGASAALLAREGTTMSSTKMRLQGGGGGGHMSRGPPGRSDPAAGAFRSAQHGVAHMAQHGTAERSAACLDTARRGAACVPDHDAAHADSQQIVNNGIHRSGGVEGAVVAAGDREDGTGEEAERGWRAGGAAGGWHVPGTRASAVGNLTAPQRSAFLFPRLT